VGAGRLGAAFRKIISPPPPFPTPHQNTAHPTPHALEPAVRPGRQVPHVHVRNLPPRRVHAAHEDDAVADRDERAARRLDDVVVPPPVPQVRLVPVVRLPLPVDQFVLEGGGEGAGRGGGGGAVHDGGEAARREEVGDVGGGEAADEGVDSVGGVHDLGGGGKTGQREGVCCPRWGGRCSWRGRCERKNAPGLGLCVALSSPTVTRLSISACVGQAGHARGGGGGRRLRRAQREARRGFWLDASGTGRDVDPRQPPGRVERVLCDERVRGPPTAAREAGGKTTLLVVRDGAEKKTHSLRVGLSPRRPPPQN
jgi:hypothetical protein